MRASALSPRASEKARPRQCVPEGRTVLGSGAQRSLCCSRVSWVSGWPCRERDSARLHGTAARDLREGPAAHRLASGRPGLLAEPASGQEAQGSSEPGSSEAPGVLGAPVMPSGLPCPPGPWTTGCSWTRWDELGGCGPETDTPLARVPRGCQAGEGGPALPGNPLPHGPPCPSEDAPPTPLCSQAWGPPGLPSPTWACSGSSRACGPGPGCREELGRCEARLSLQTQETWVLVILLESSSYFRNDFLGKIAVLPQAQLFRKRCLLPNILYGWHLATVLSWVSL